MTIQHGQHGQQEGKWKEINELQKSLQESLNFVKEMKAVILEDCRKSESDYSFIESRKRDLEKTLQDLSEQEDKAGALFIPSEYNENRKEQDLIQEELQLVLEQQRRKWEILEQKKQKTAKMNQLLECLKSIDLFMDQMNREQDLKGKEMEEEEIIGENVLGEEIEGMSRPEENIAEEKHFEENAFIESIIGGRNFEKIAVGIESGQNQNSEEETEKGAEEKSETEKKKETKEEKEGKEEKEKIEGKDEIEEKGEIERKDEIEEKGETEEKRETEGREEIEGNEKTEENEEEKGKEEIKGIKETEKKGEIERKEEIEEKIGAKEEKPEVKSDTVTLQGGTEIKDRNLKDIGKRESAALLSIQEYERKRIAREMHDSTIQDMTTLIHRIEFVEKLIDMDVMRARMELSTLKEMVKKSVDEMRNIIYDLHPVQIEEFGLKAILQKFVARISEEYKISINLSAEDDQCKDCTVNLALYRIIQEACSNSIRYSEATQIIIELKYMEDEIQLVIEDNGLGFDVEEVQKKAMSEGRGFGLSVMKERVYLLSGKFEISSASGAGTKITVIVPRLV